MQKWGNWRLLQKSVQHKSLKYSPNFKQIGTLQMKWQYEFAVVFENSLLKGPRIKDPRYPNPEHYLKPFSLSFSLSTSHRLPREVNKKNPLTGPQGI